MMPVVRISDRTWERLKSHARPFEDTPEDIIRSALDALDRHKGRSIPTENKKPVRKSAAPKLPQREFRDPLLKLLLEMGGSASVADIREKLEPRISHMLLQGDYELVSTGEQRWWNAVCWERNDMKKAGLIAEGSPRGEWSLTEEGRSVGARLSQ